MRYALSIGLAVVLQFLVYQLLRYFPSRSVIRVLVLVATTCAVGALLVMAELRASQFTRQLNVNDAIVVGEQSPQTVSDADVKRDGDRLWWAMVLMALAFEIGAGLALHDYITTRKATNFGLLNSLEKDLLKIEQELLSVVEAKQALLAAPERRYAATMRAIDQPPAASGTNWSGISRLALLILLLLLASLWLKAADRLHLIGVIDPSKSQGTMTSTGRSEFEENRLALSQLFANLPAGSQLTALGVTSMSYANPFVILEARLSPDAGYLGTRLTEGRRRIVNAWDARTKKLVPSELHTDVFGLLRFAGESFARSDAERRVLAFSGDMRNDVGLDLETPQKINVEQALRFAEQHHLFAPLNGVEVYVTAAGEHRGKRGNEYALGLRQFYTEYFRRSGAKLRMFTTSRDVQGLIEAVAVKQTKVSAR